MKKLHCRGLYIQQWERWLLDLIEDNPRSLDVPDSPLMLYGDWI